MYNYFSPSKIFLYIMIFFVLGVFIGESFDISLPPHYIAVLLFLFLIIIPTSKKLSKRLFLCFFFFLLFCFLGIYRFNSFLPKINEKHIGFYNNNGQEYKIQGLISSEPDIRENAVKIQISNIKIESNKIISYQDSNSYLNGKILIDLPKYTDIKYGDVIVFKAKLTEPKEYEDFSYKNYLARYGIYSLARNIDDLEIIERNKGSIFLSTLYNVKNYFSSIIEKIFPEPHSSFMLGLLIGVKKSLPDWLLEIFRITGITHIIAISGYNISILARITEKTLGKISRRYIFWGVSALIILFVILTGAQASIVRAGIMGALLVFSGFVGRKTQVTNALVFAGVIMIVLNPLILKHDIGFQLSFLATLGLVYITPIFKKPFAVLPDIIKESLTATLAAQVLVLPIILSNFGTLSLISPIANILVLPFIPLAMFFGFIAGASGIIWFFLGQALGFFGYIILEIIIWTSTTLSKIPYASIEIKFDNWWIWSGYYLLVFGLLWLFRDKIYKTKIEQK